jgi:phosphoserine phosphatase
MPGCGKISLYEELIVARLLLIRHGRTNLQKEDRYWGSTDIPLNAEGVKQADRIKDRLAKAKITHIYSSALKRANDTAKTTADAQHKTITACQELNEFNFGYAEGLTYKEIEKQYPALAKQMGEMGDITFPGGESLGKFYMRTGTFLKRLESHKPEDVIAVFGHAGSLRMLICHLLELEQKYWYKLFLDYASVSIIDTYGQISIINTLNDTCHLKHKDVDEPKTTP